MFILKSQTLAGENTIERFHSESSALSEFNARLNTGILRMTVHHVIRGGRELIRSFCPADPLSFQYQLN